MEKKNFDHLKTKSPHGSFSPIKKTKLKIDHSLNSPTLPNKEYNDADTPIQIYCNELILYPKNHGKKHIKSFLELLYKSFNPKPEEQKKLKKIIFTSFGFEYPILMPIAQKGVKVTSNHIFILTIRF